VETAAGGYEALDAVARRPPSVVVLDVTMPDLDGVKVVRRLRDEGNDVPVCILSARDDVEDRVAGLQAGADDYLVKPFAAEELLARVRALHRRGREPVETLAYGDVVLDVKARRAQRAGRALELSAREADLLELLLRNSEQVVSRELALDRVWGGRSLATHNAVDRYVSYLRHKLGDPPLIQTVRGVGFVLSR